MQLNDALRETDYVFKMQRNSLAILLVETSEEAARTVIGRLADEFEHSLLGYGYTVTSFPSDANAADDFLSKALERHWAMHRQLYPDDHGEDSSQQPSPDH